MSRSGANIVLRHRTPLPPSLPRRLFSSSAPALVSDQQSFHLPSGRLKVSLSAPYLIGRAQSRGERPYQEDNFLVKSVTIAREEVERSLQEGLSGEQRKGGAWKGKAKDVGKIEDPTEQVLLAAVFDGHNGKEASGYLTEHLAEIVETCKADQVPDAIRKYRDLGGYFRRFRGGYLENLGNEVWQRSEASSDSKSDSDAASSSTHKSPARPLELGERMTLAFLLADQHLISAHPDVGAVATVVLLTPLPPAPPSPPTLYPFHSSPALLLTVAHLGDTRALLCASRSGRVEKLTEEHHPDSRVEADRLRRIGTGVVTDSFGESRWGGALANTRGLGDAKFKKLGVTGEPQIAKRILKGEDWAFLVLVSDGVSEVMSDQEIVDLCRGKPDPTKAAEEIINFAEQVGAQDNMTAVVLPLAGWKNLGGSDSTASRREYRLRQSAGQSSRARRM